MSKGTITICIDDDLIPIVKELQSQRRFSAFVQDCLRSHRKIIEAESLEAEKNKLIDEIKNFEDRISMIDSRLDQVKEEAKDQATMNELENELRRLNAMKKSLDHWESLSINKRPKEWHEWNNKRNAIAKSLKDAGFDFSKLRGDN